MFETTISCSLTKDDFIETAQLQINKYSYLINWYMIILIFYLSWLEFKRIYNPDFITFDFALEIAEKYSVPQTTKDHIFNLIICLIGFIYYFGQIHPKYSLINRWNISKKYQTNFLKQETKTITINEAGIKIVSANYREIRQWQDYNKFAENKKLFLLFGQGSNNIIPKRIFNTEENLNSFRALLESKIKPQKSAKNT